MNELSNNKFKQQVDKYLIDACEKQCELLKENQTGLLSKLRIIYNDGNDEYEIQIIIHL